AFLDYVAWLSLPPPRTHLRSVRKLPAGHRLMTSLKQPECIRVEKFWSYSLEQPPELTNMEAAVEQLDEALRDSTKAHLRADVPLGVLLSSGLDSRLVAKYAQDLRGGGLSTFSVGFTDGASELCEAAKTAAEISSTHHALVITPSQLMENIGRVAWHLDEP